MDRRKIMTIQKINRCQLCGGALDEKEVEKLLHGGVKVAVVKVPAEVCLHSGRRLYTEETIKRFEDKGIQTKVNNLYIL